jgi:hypothetical protein
MLEPGDEQGLRDAAARPTHDHAHGMYGDIMSIAVTGRVALEPEHDHEGPNRMRCGPGATAFEPSRRSD